MELIGDRKDNWDLSVLVAVEATACRGWILCDGNNVYPGRIIGISVRTYFASEGKRDAPVLEEQQLVSPREAFYVIGKAIRNSCY